MVRELRLAFELSDEHDAEGRKRVITRLYNRSFHKQSSLYRDLTTWLEVPYLGANRLDGRFDFGQLIRLGAQLELTRPGQRNWRIESIRPGAAMHLVERDPVVFNIDNFDVEMFHRLPEPLRDRIMASPTFLEHHGYFETHKTNEIVRPFSSDELKDDEVPW